MNAASAVERTSAGPAVSVVVPVFNAMPYLRELMESLAAQDLDASAYEVIAVDDGSTDGSGAFLHDFAERHANVQVVHQDNSGWPGRPRNAGLRRSTGRYVFFADADDVVAPEALRRLVEFADRHQADVVIPKLAALGGRRFPASVFEHTIIDATLSTAFETLFPQKLFRCALLTERAIWFPEGMRLEDGIFNAHAYVHARRICVLGDYDYYYLRARDDGRNTSLQAREPASYTAAVAEIVRIIREGVADRDIADRLVLDVYRRKCLQIYHPRRFPHCPVSTQEAWLAEHRRFVERFISEGMERRLATRFRERSHFVRHGDRVGLLELLGAQDAPVVDATMADARGVSEGIELVIRARIRGRLELPRQVVCEIRPRDGDGLAAFSLVRRESPAPDAPGAAYVGVLTVPTLRDLAAGAYDLYLVSAAGADRVTARVAWGAGRAFERRGVRLAGTKGGSTILKKRPDGGLRLDVRQVMNRIAEGVRGRR